VSLKKCLVSGVDQGEYLMSVGLPLPGNKEVLKTDGEMPRGHRDLLEGDSTDQSWDKLRIRMEIDDNQ
jgi:hypothetical protein